MNVDFYVTTLTTDDSSSSSLVVLPGDVVHAVLDESADDVSAAIGKTVIEIFFFSINKRQTLDALLCVNPSPLPKPCL